MRLSQLVNNETYRDNTELMFYHGTTTKSTKSFLNKGVGIPKLTGNKKRDFGEGFYLTTHFWQAKIFAETRIGFSNAEPLIVSCVIPLGALRTIKEKCLIVDEYNERWLEFILRGRFEREKNPLQNDFDWIYGRCGDGYTEDVQKMYESGERDLNKMLPHTIPNRNRINYEYDQLWLGTKTALDCIKSVEFVHSKGVDSNEKIPLHK